MEKDRKETLEQILQEYQNLPTKWQKVIGWMVENWEFVKAICKDTTMTNEEMEKIIEEARAREDTSMEILCRLAMCLKEQKSEQDRRTDNPRSGMKG